MLRIVSLNLNGIRSAAGKGVFDWLAASGADIVCLQELKAQLPDLSARMLAPDGYRGWFHCAEKKGYSGVGIYSRHVPARVSEGIGNAEFDAEGRYLRIDFDAPLTRLVASATPEDENAQRQIEHPPPHPRPGAGLPFNSLRSISPGAPAPLFHAKKLSVISLYLPSGSSSPERQEAKFRFMELFFPILKSLREEGREIVLCGDWNIAHKEIDLKNWKGNLKNSGFLPEERAWLTQVFDKVGWVDVYRRLHPETTGEAYTWWSNRGQARAKNVGWRIDYQIATPDIAATVKSARVYKDRFFSDHAPLIVDYDWAL